MKPIRRLWSRSALVSLFATLLFASALVGIRAQRGDAQDHGRTPPRAAAPTPRSSHASITAGMDCNACHTPAGWGMGGGGQSGRGFDHARTGFPLVGRHAQTACTACHRAGVRVRSECASCHQDSHQGQLGRDCQRCHSATRWSDTRAFEMHRNTRLPLTGRHAMIDCTECHRRTGDRQFTAIPADCFSCHEADYRRPTTHPDHTGATGLHAPFSRDCATCHQTGSWSPAFIDPAGSGALPLMDASEHDALFPIRVGPHRGLQCAQCHIAPQVPRAVDCTGCHAHNPVLLRQQHHGQLVAPDATACLSCHPGGSGR